jgi:hypothetical protein
MTEETTDREDDVTTPGENRSYMPINTRMPTAEWKGMMAAIADARARGEKVSIQSFLADAVREKLAANKN